MIRTRTLWRMAGLLLLMAGGVTTWLWAQQRDGGETAPSKSKDDSKQASAGGDGAAAGGPGGPEMPPPQVSYFVTTSADMPVHFEYVGTLEPFRTIEINSRIKGFIDQRLFEEGQQVRAGQTLYMIDPRTLRADLRIMHAKLNQAEAQREFAEREFNRLSPLRETGAISQTDLDRTESRVTETEAAVNLARAELDKAELELSFTKIVSPAAGLVGRIERDQGGYVDDFQNSRMTEVYQIDPIYVTFRVSEREYLTQRESIEAGRLVKAGGIEPYVEIVTADNQLLRQHGEFRFQDPRADQQTGTFLFRAEFSNPGYKLRPGQFVKARIVGWQRPDAIAIPQRAVQQSPTGAGVMVLGDNDLPAFRPVKPGEWSGPNWIINEGLKPGEKVVVEGMAIPGMPVKPVLYTAAATSQSTTTNPSTAPERGAATATTSAEKRVASQ